MPKAKKTEGEIAATPIPSYGRHEIESIHIFDLAKGLEQERDGTAWETGARVEAGGDLHKDSVPGANFYYRAMSTREYYHLRKNGFVPQSDAHQGLAPNRAYPKTYMIRSYGGTHLVEFRFPTAFRETLYSQGWKEGSLEDGCLAWGIGRRQKNSWKRDDSRGIQTIPKTKSEARHPYDIYMDFARAGQVKWRLVNVKYFREDWAEAIQKGLT